jgi:hypothetical protein
LVEGYCQSCSVGMRNDEPCRHGRLAGAIHDAAATESRALLRAVFCSAPADTRKHRFRFHGCDRPHRSSSFSHHIALSLASFDHFSTNNSNIYAPTTENENGVSLAVPIPSTSRVRQSACF